MSRSSRARATPWDRPEQLVRERPLHHLRAALAFPRTSDVGSCPCSANASRFRWCTPTTSKRSGMFSPDGRWIAYATDDSGQPNVFVQAFPEAGRELQVSTDGGGRLPFGDRMARSWAISPWTPTLMAVPIDATARIDVGPAAKPLFQAARAETFQRQPGSMRVTKDGQRFLLPATRPQHTIDEPYLTCGRQLAVGDPAVVMALTPGTRLGPYEVARAARRRRHGRGLSRARHAAQSRRRDQDPAGRSSPAIPNGWRGSSAKRRRSRRSTIRTSRTSTASKRSATSARW